MNEHSDWTGNGTSVYKMIGASNHSEEEREQNDYYATDPIAVEMLLERETFSHEIWEPACGGGTYIKNSLCTRLQCEMHRPYQTHSRGNRS